MIAKFAGKCRRCGCRFAAGTEIAWSRATGATHTTPEICAQVRAVVMAQYDALPKAHADGSKIVAFLVAARDRGLKWPKAAFMGPRGLPVVLSIAGPRAKVPGSVQVVEGLSRFDKQWLGRIEPDGTVVGRLAGDEGTLDLLKRIGEDPAKAAKEYGVLTGNCSFCGKRLNDEGSVEAGYGPVCAKKYGLPHHRKGARVLSEVATGSMPA